MADMSGYEKAALDPDVPVISKEDYIGWLEGYVNALERFLSPVARDEAVWRANNNGPKSRAPSDV